MPRGEAQSGSAPVVWYGATARPKLFEAMHGLGFFSDRPPPWPPPTAYDFPRGDMHWNPAGHRAWLEAALPTLEPHLRNAHPSR